MHRVKGDLIEPLKRGSSVIPIKLAFSGIAIRFAMPDTWQAQSLAILFEKGSTSWKDDGTYCRSVRKT